MNKTKKNTIWFDELNKDDIAIVGGKNASLGEMIKTLKKKKIRVPNGFATTANAYRQFLEDNDLMTSIKKELTALNNKRQSLEKTGKKIRRQIMHAKFPQQLKQDIESSYFKLSQIYKKRSVDVAVRSSATSEDLPEASFAGQQESFLNVTGLDELLEACQKCYASVFTDRAISYRREHGFDHIKIALSVGIQKMVRSDKAGSGVMFSIDTETGFPNVVIINAAWGLGENIVQGKVTPDEYVILKPLLDKKKVTPIITKEKGYKKKKMIYAKSGRKTTKNVKTSTKERESIVLSDTEILTLGRWACAIEKHYKRPMDMEWAKDGKTKELFIVQARPETVQTQRESGFLKTYTLKDKGRERVKGLAIGQAIASGKAQIIKSARQMDTFKDGAILITEMTDPDWVPIMKKASGIVTDHGGRTSHAAIVSRELGLPAIVGTGVASKKIKDGEEITLSCAQGDEGYVYKGILKYEQKKIDLEKIPKPKTHLMMNMASPAAAFRWWRLPVQGIGLARMEFIINNIVKIHPMALIHFNKLEKKSDKEKITQLTKDYKNKKDYFIEKLGRAIAKIAASQYPNPVIVRMSDFKTNEYANLVGGKQFEPQEDNPMIGFRGASRYYNEKYREGFALECKAIAYVREKIGLDNIIIMIPFCRTLEEADNVLNILKKNNLRKGNKKLLVYVMGEIPANVFLAEKFAEKFDGISIGSNDLTQLILGSDRDSHDLANIFDERNDAVKIAIKEMIKEAHTKKCKVGICGQAPSDYPEFAQFLVECGIDSISLNPDSVVEVIRRIVKIETKNK